MCIVFLLKGEARCKWGDKWHRRHLTPEDADARAMRVGDGPNCISQRGLTDAVTGAPKELILRFFDAWGDQMQHFQIGNIWNKLGQQLRDDRGREAWVAANGEVLARLRRRSVEVLPECNAQAIANIVHGAAHVGLEAGELRGGRAVRRLDFDQQNIANTVWAFATAGHAAPPLFDAVACAAARRATRRTLPTRCGRCATRFQHGVGIRHGRPRFATGALFEAVAEAAARRLRDFKPQAIRCGRSRPWTTRRRPSSPRWRRRQQGGCATSSRRRVGILTRRFDAVAAEGGRLRDFEPQHLANTAWAFAVTDARHPQFIAALTERLAQPGLALTRRAHAAAAVSLWCELELRLPEAQLLPPPLRERCRDELRAVASGTEEKHARQAAYRLEKSVGRALGRLGLSPTAEHALAEGYSVDFAFVDEQIAIEVDGPTHFALSGDGAGRRPVGKTVLKRRLLAALGWRLLSVTREEWDPLCCGAQQPR